MKPLDMARMHKKNFFVCILHLTIEDGNISIFFKAIILSNKIFLRIMSDTVIKN